MSHYLGEFSVIFAPEITALSIILMTIDKNILSAYIENNQVEFQFCDGLIEFTSIDGFYDEEDVECDILNHVVEMNTAIKEAKEIKVVDAAEFMEDRDAVFYEFARWTEGKDLLLLVDDQLLVCIPGCDKNKFIAEAA